MPTNDYHAHLIETLQDADEAAAYLTACLDDSEEVFLLGLRHVAEALGGVGKLSKETQLNRESLYRMLSEDGNPRLSSLAKVLSVLGLQIQFSPADHNETEAA